MKVCIMGPNYVPGQKQRRRAVRTGWVDRTADQGQLDGKSSYDTSARCSDESADTSSSFSEGLVALGNERVTR